MLINKQITKNFNLNEAIDSFKAKRLKIDNTPDLDVILNLENIIKKIGQPARDILKKPIIITSGYRSKALNVAVNGSKNSQHVKGEALDLDTAGHRFNKELFHIINKMTFDQLIWEYSADPEKDIFNTYPFWVHVSLKKDGVNRKEILRVEKTGTTKIEL